MLIIFGTKPVGTIIQQGIFSCPYCRTERNYLLKRHKSYFTLFFIPLIPLKNLGDSTECQTCKKSYIPQNHTLQPDSQTLNPTPPVPAKRFGAYIIDIILLTIFTFPAAFLIRMLPSELQQFLQYRFYIVIFLLWFLYFFLFEYFTKGYTVGKKMFSLQTLNKDGNDHLSIGQTLIRSLVKIIPILPIVLLFTKNNRALHDYAAGSIVANRLNPG